MKRFKNILFYVDGSDDLTASLLRAVSLAKSNQAKLTLIDVIEAVETPPQVSERFDVDLTDLLVSQRNLALEEIASQIKDEHVLISTQVLTGIPFVEVIKQILSNQYDLLMKVARPPTGLGEKVFGSNDLHLLRKCPCPVLVDRQNARDNYRHVLAAVSLTPSPRSSCNTMVMQLSTSLCEREKAQLGIVHAWQMEAESMFRYGRFYLPEVELDAMLKHEKSTHKDNLENLLSDFEISIDDPNIYLIKGHAAVSINRVADLIEADIIVMCTVGRTGIPGLFIGNTAEEVLQTTNASILAVKPDGFISPIE